MTSGASDHPGVVTPPRSRLSPVDALRAIRRVLGDKRLTPAERIVIIAVIVRADNETSLAWASYRSLMRETGFAPATIRAALQKANGVHIERAARGERGAIQYRVLALQGMKRASASEALQEDKRASQGEEPALHCAPSSASQVEAILTPLTGPNSTGPRESALVTWDGRTFKVPETVMADYCARWPDVPRERIEGEIRDAGDYHAEKKTKIRAPRGTLTGWLKRAFDSDGQPHGRSRATHAAPSYQTNEAAAVAVDLTDKESAQ